MEESADLQFAIANQRHEFVAASAAESDLELAFRLQLQEALSASILHSSPSSSASAAAAPEVPVTDPSSSTSDAGIALARALDIQSVELERYQQECQDNELSRSELRRAAENLRLRAHDEKFAHLIEEMPDDEWDDFGDEFERPIELLSAEEELPFKLYFKGMARLELVQGQWTQLAGIGVAVCGPRGDLLLKIQKPVLVAGTNREVLEAKALIEGLNAVVGLGIKNVNVYFDFRPLHNHVIGRWRPKQQKIVNLIDQVRLLQRKINRSRMFLLPRCHVKFVFKLVRDVIDSQITKGEEEEEEEFLQPNTKKKTTTMETCNICLEVTPSSQMFVVPVCGHRFCFFCMMQHVEVKLLHGTIPGCPHLGCTVKLDEESSRRFLSPRLLDMLLQRIREDSIPPGEKVYCPYPKCSALMSLNEVSSPPRPAKLNAADDPCLRKCAKCAGHFCISCKVPWHAGMSCLEHKILNPHSSAADARLHSLAREKLWRQCVKCNHMIELTEGCFHMTCRCGYEFCYTCGAEWLDKQATCGCPLWNEEYIWYDNSEESEDDYYDDEDDDYEDDEDYYE